MDQPQKLPRKGRGAQFNPDNRFLAQSRFTDPDLHDSFPDAEEEPPVKTRFLEIFPKQILSRVDSPDLGLYWSVNPYQGCEHGCTYCYARSSHEYYGYSAGLDFESIILVKKAAPELLDKALLAPSWKPEPINISGNTDCYQPCERDLGITRRLLEVLNRHGNPTSIITKNVLILRDLDILKEMARKEIIHVYLSITTLDEKLRRVLEPRTATSGQKLEAIRKLTKAGIPVGVMTAPMIPSLNDHEIHGLIKAAADAGASTAGYTAVRLNGAIGALFKDWLEVHFPDRASKVISQIESMHGGNLNDSQWGRRMTGEGPWANMIREVHRKAKAKYMEGRTMPPYNLAAFTKGGQLSLF